MLNKKTESRERMREIFYEKGHVLESAIDKISDFRGEIVEKLGFAPIFVVQQKTERFMPRINLFDHDDAFLVSVEVPGIPAEQLKLTVTTDWLLITGERCHEAEQGKILFLEQLDGKFSRKLPLEAPVLGTDCHAQLDRGVLWVTLSKAHPGTMEPNEFSISVKEKS